MVETQFATGQEQMGLLNYLDNNINNSKYLYSAFLLNYSKHSLCRSIHQNSNSYQPFKTFILIHQLNHFITLSSTVILINIYIAHFFEVTQSAAQANCATFEERVAQFRVYQSQCTSQCQCISYKEYSSKTLNKWSSSFIT